MNFRFVHLYSDASVDAGVVAKEISGIFPSCKIDVRHPIKCNDGIVQAKITDVKQPLEKQPRQSREVMSLYDGFVLQRIFARKIPATETDHIHMIFTSLLTCTFSEDDWRYHSRTVICGTPSIVSTTGIVEAPAKSKEFYLDQLGGVADLTGLRRKYAGKFIDYNDKTITLAASIYALQALFFFVTDGDPFCENKNCRLYNAHWQEELIRQIKEGALCPFHKRLVRNFNKGVSGK